MGRRCLSANPKETRTQDQPTDGGCRDHPKHGTRAPFHLFTPSSSRSCAHAHAGAGGCLRRSGHVGSAQPLGAAAPRPAAAAGGAGGAAGGDGGEGEGGGGEGRARGGEGRGGEESTPIPSKPESGEGEDWPGQGDW